MTITIPYREVCAHEAAHVASILVSGLPAPLFVRTDSPDSRAGVVKLDWEAMDPTPDVLKSVLVSVLAGPASEGYHAQIFDWPPETGDWPDFCLQDARQARYLAERLNIDQIGWGQLCYRADRLWRDSRFKRLCVAIREELEDKELLVKPELQKLADRVLGAPHD